MNETKEPRLLRYVATVRIHVQCSANYDTEPRIATLICDEKTTIADVSGWAKRLNCLGRGDIVITESDS